VDQQQPLVENRRFGQYLRKIREERKLSLDAVEEMSLGLSDRVTKSHLSRIENGQAIPSFPRMFSLSQIYGVPVSSLAERFELCLKADQYSAETATKPLDELEAEARTLRRAGRHDQALLIYESLLERIDEYPVSHSAAHRVDLELECINCLVKLNRESTAKDECEKLLSSPALTPRQKVVALHLLAYCSQRLGKYTVAMMAVEQAERSLAVVEEPGDLSAFLMQLKGDVLAYTGRFEEGVEAYGAAMQLFEARANGFEACRTALNLAACLIETDAGPRARRILKEALEQAEQAGYDRQRAYALSHLGLLAFREGDLEAAETYCLRSNQVARPREYVSVLFRNCFYLWKLSRTRGDAAGAKVHERTLRTYVNRVERSMPEAEAFRSFLGGGQDE
jgi:tetratricopeptide (TPR) repeat protein